VPTAHHTSIGVLCEIRGKIVIRAVFREIRGKS
jgi:hypothetical protein